MSRWRWVLGTAVAATIATVTWATPANSRPAVPPNRAPATPEIAVPWQPGRPELGIHVYWENNPADSDAVLRAKARRLLDQVVGLEANSVAVSFPFFVDSTAASIVRTDDPRTPSPERLTIVLEEARDVGLRTTIRPLLDQNPLTDGWRGELAPADRTAWYASYQAFLEPYLGVAERDRVDTVVLGAELSAMQADPQWSGLAAWARRVYHGELAYSANWDAYPQAVAGVPVDRIDIDAYPMLGLWSDSSERAMTDAWAAWLDRTAPGAVPELVLSEVGGSAESTMVDNPARAHTPGAALDEDIQRRWFGAACRAARDRHVAGLYWWKLDLYLDPALADPATDRHDTFLGRPAERVIRECFARWAAPT
jgi:hypothetical protein